MTTGDVFDAYDDAVRHRRTTENPWHLTSADPIFEPDYALLETLLAIPVRAGHGSESGRFAAAIDAWVAAELRRAGFPADDVWPRAEKPRVLPRELGLFVSGLPRQLREQVEPYLSKRPNVAPRDAKVLASVFQ